MTRMGGSSAIFESLGPELERVRDLVRSSLSSDIALLNSANEAMLKGEGKMIRPALAVLCAKACSGDIYTEDTLRFAAAAELMHNATLLHDDVVDASPLRRGHPTVNALFGGRAAVLLGDYWLVKSMDRILEARDNSDKAIRIFAKTLSDLAEGELLQMQKASSCDTTESDYLRIVFSKTASLFEAAAWTAALSVGASKEAVKAVRTYAVRLGTAFQIKDDILDYSGSPALGKPVGLDLTEQKITMPLLGALKACPSANEEIRAKVRDIPGKPALKDEVVAFVMEKDGIGYASRKADEYVQMACIALRSLPKGDAKDKLVALAGFITERNK